ncbi:MAG: hypothetical protein FWF81_04155 [Defluviitaleaceae bacterium]|nr:hypothetical protein [Defluviitaleaceae bacterium]
MVCSFNWNAPPNKNTKTAEAVARQYIKAKYGLTPAEFAKKIITEQAPQEKLADKIG